EGQGRVPCSRRLPADCEHSGLASTDSLSPSARSSMAADITARDGDIAARTLLEQAGATLKNIDPQVPASLAARAYALLAGREPGAPKIRCAAVDLTESGDRRAIGVVELVNDDMPFLLDSVMGELSERRLAVRLVAHPVLDVDRKGGRLAAIGGAGAGARESFIHLHVDGLAGEEACAELTKALAGILAEVRLAVADWRPMLERVNGIVAELKNNPPPVGD